jgi:hypothetical protein
MSLPLHDFFRGLLFFYGLELHHLTPNGILQIACFVALCEYFLGTQPHFGLWRKYIRVKAQKNGGGFCECGYALIQLRPKVTYFDFGLPDSEEMAARLVLLS